MIFKYQDFSNQLEWTDSKHLCELVIENPVTLRNVLQSLTTSEEGSRLSFMEASKTLSLEKDIDIILNPTKLEFNNRRAMTTLLKLLVKTSVSEDFYLETGKIKAKILQYLDKMIDAEDFIFEVAGDDFTIDTLAKAVNIHIMSDDDDFIEILTDYLAMMVELVGIKIFVFLNLRSLVSHVELERLHHNLKNHQINVLLLENYDRGKFENISRIIIDQDDCEI